MDSWATMIISAEPGPDLSADWQHDASSADAPARFLTIVEPMPGALDLAERVLAHRPDRSGIAWLLVVPPPAGEPGSTSPADEAGSAGQTILADRITRLADPTRIVRENGHWQHLPPGQFPSGSGLARSEEHTSELQSLGYTSYAVFCLKKKRGPRDRKSVV